MKAEANRCMLRERAYAMKKHHARRLHYDLRLEWNGVLLSWALPKGPSYCAGVICQAIEMDDHSRANLLFEGVHETGTIALWDRGTWEPHLESDDIEGSLRRGILRFTLHGERLRGAWSLVGTKQYKKYVPADLDAVQRLRCVCRRYVCFGRADGQHYWKEHRTDSSGLDETQRKTPAAIQAFRHIG